MPKTQNICAQFFLAILVILIGSTTSVQAQLLDYGTFSGYGLGKGILGNDYSQPLPACITGTHTTLPASQANVRASIVYRADEYRQAFHVDQKAQASFLNIAGGSEELHIGRETGRSGSAFDIILEASGEHDSDTLGNVRWDPQYESKINSGDPQKIQEVRAACGDRFIETVFNEVRLFAVLHVSAERSSSLTSFSGRASGNLNLSVVSASAALGGDVNVSSAHQSGAISVEIFSEGLGGIIPTSEAIRISTADGLEGIATKLANYVSSLHETGQPVKYQLAPLPGIRSGNLTDERIFSYLETLKSNYASASSRLSNVTALLGGDERRLVLKQPQADVALRQQEVVLSSYADAVSQGHDDCRKASQVSFCSEASNRLASPPMRAPVELPPASPPLIQPYTFVIDGVPIAPGQNVLLLSNVDQTLFEAARSINPNAVNVDLLAQIPSAYVSHVEVIWTKPQPPPFAPLTLGGLSLLPQDISPPPYFPIEARESAFIRVLHADARHPCSLHASEGLNLADDSCLTSAGKVLRDIAEADLANYVVATDYNTTKTYDFPEMAVVHSCFAPPIAMPIAQIRIDVFKGPFFASNNAQTGRLGLFVVLPGIAIHLAEQWKWHEPEAWQQLARDRPAIDHASPATEAAINPCSPHVP